MKTALCSALAGAALLASAGIASAGEPVKLSDSQLDGVTASGAAAAFASSFTLGDLLSETFALTSTFVDDGRFAAASANARGLAASVVFGAASSSHSNAGAALP